MRDVVLKIKEINFWPMGAQQQQFQRPFVANINTDNCLEIVKKVAGAKKKFMEQIEQGLISPDSTDLFSEERNVAGLSGQLVTHACKGVPVNLPTATGESWAVEVASFLIEVEVQYLGGYGTTIQYIAGFTDRAVSLDGSPLDPEMRLTINSIFSARKWQVPTPLGVEEGIDLLSANQVLFNANCAGALSFEKAPIRIRPSDIFGGIELNKVKFLSGGIEVYDARRAHNHIPVFSKYAHNDADTWTEEIVKAGIVGQHLAQRDNRPHEVNMLASRLVLDSTAMRDPFMKALCSVIDGATTAQFSMSDLARIDPAVVERVSIQPVLTNNHSEVLSSWEGQDATTIAATRIAQSVPALMAKHDVRVLQFVGCNVDNGDMKVTAIGSAGIFKFTDSEKLQLLLDDIKERILLPLSFNNQMLFNLNGRFDLFGTSNFDLEIDWPREKRHFSSPTFANSLFSPVITNDYVQSDETVSSFENLLIELNCML